MIVFLSLDPYGKFQDPNLDPCGEFPDSDPFTGNNSYESASLFYGDLSGLVLTFWKKLFL